MRVNPVKAALRSGKTVLGIGIGVTASPVVVRLMANAGFDWLFIDTEHTQIDPHTLTDVVQTARLAGVSPIIRPRDTEYDLVAGALDTGADGLLVPRVESKEQAERLLSYCMFPPRGVRGCGTTANIDFKSEDWREALPWLNDQTLIAVQVESMKAVNALDEILQVPGIDVVVVGPLDLSINLGVPGQFRDAKMISAIDKVIDVCKAHGVVSGIVMGPPSACEAWWEKGMRFFSCGGDTGLLMNGGMEMVKTVRAFGGAKSST
jgi:2-dehydro-3-deoxyglucarate aldolase/4-hydroxy-2-oxoheptanedioate aldolase